MGTNRMSRSSGEREFSLATSEDRLVWIFGSSRSGSTWLLRMLSGLKGAVAVDDPHLGHHLGVWRPIPLAWSASEHQPKLTTLLDLKRHKPGYLFSDRYRDAWAPALRGLIVSRFDAQVHEALANGRPSGTPLVVVKEPGSHVADLLLELFPASRMIFLLRDGRDVVDSWLAAHRPGSWAVREGAFPVADGGREALIRWQASVWAYRTDVVQRAYQEHEPSQRIIVRYEELLRNPAGSSSASARRWGWMRNASGSRRRPPSTPSRASPEPRRETARRSGRAAGGVASQPDRRRAAGDVRGDGGQALRARLSGRPGRPGRLSLALTAHGPSPVSPGAAWRPAEGRRRSSRVGRGRRA